ncbi:alpha/beta hydrolase [Sphingomonas paeninsulae]|uniref:Alpha/beta hydrolase n=1 Tax=Sphingomonas paeninsulae TaxID=2319844 RepID=A0A494TBI3_SPHPE|nr:alpha/beta hydrolase [Sphingomonas paeninsulae]AYJ86490.1 alpha/beta hydrolase [Sphingomonas paeninsulae]
MTELRRERFALSTGVELDVTIGGPEGAPAIIFLHGFPESARTWRFQLDDLARDFRVVAPDQRGYARSSKPEGVENYTPDKPVADLFALADALGIDKFTLVGHDWGGAIAWGAALGNPARIERLVILNAPHPFVFQKSLFDDMTQREGSQYIRAFRTPGMENFLAADLGAFFDRIFGPSGIGSTAAPEERAAYIDEWSQPGAILSMLNWYRAAQIIVPAMDETPARPAYLAAPFPVVQMPTLVIWGMADKALTPAQLDGLDALVADLKIVKIPDAGHFVTWEQPQAVIEAIRSFLR